MSRKLLPLFVDVSGATVVVTGSGATALAAVRRLTDLGAIVRHHEGGSAGPDLDGALLVVAASEDSAADATTLEAASGRGMVTASLTGGEASAHIGELASRGDVALAVTTSSRSPELEAHLVGKAAPVMLAEHDRFAEILGTLREKLAERYPDDERRAQIWQMVLDSPVLVLLQQGLDDEAVELAERMAWGTG